MTPREHAERALARWSSAGPTLIDLVTAACEAAAADAREEAAKVCEAMVVGGRAWNEGQQVAAKALLAAAENIRALNRKDPPDAR